MRSWFRPFQLSNAIVTVAVAITLMSAQLVVAGEIATNARWGGQAGKIGDGNSGYMCSQEDLEAFWQQWAIAKPLPNITFKTELAVFYMGAGGPYLMSLTLEDSGDLVAVYVQSPTVSLYPNYLIFTVPRDGIKSINGTAVFCPESVSGQLQTGSARIPRPAQA